uniref:Uncharacterized protein n=1 Tax=Knipowitschia caucasica TaxID=637954 RepID=A0AAV2IXL2_KNICA
MLSLQLRTGDNELKKDGVCGCFSGCVAAASHRGPRLGARPTPLRDPGAHNFNPGAGWSSLPGQLPDPFPYRVELDLPVPQRRNCSPTPTKRSTVDHRASSHLWASRDRSPLPAPVCGKDWSVCAPARRA